MKNLVLVDFTEESLHTLNYAVGLNKLIKGELEIVNVATGSKFDTSFDKLEDLQKKYSTDAFPVGIKELEGDLMDRLPAYVNEDKIGFVFCGTHNIQFLEQLFSSRILKLMNAVKSNFVFIPQSLKEFKPITHVLAPVFSDVHSLQKFEVLLYLRKFMPFDLTLCTYKGGEEEQDQVLYMAAKLLKKEGIPFSVRHLGRSEDDLMKKVNGFAKEIKADMISIVNLTETHLFNFGTKGFVEKLIRNEYGLPIFTIQNQKLGDFSSFHTEGGY